MNDVTTTTEERQRGQAFMLARQQLEQEYSCTVAIVPKWLPSVSKTWVMAFEEQVMVGPTPTKQEEKTDEES